MARPKKVRPKTKGIKLTETQKKYAKMVAGIEADLKVKKAEVESLDKQIDRLQEQRRKADQEARGLEGAKRNLEGILTTIEPPKEWVEFQKYVYEYHYHFHNHDCRIAPPCPYPHSPIIIGPWWQYYQGGNLIYYPTIGQLTSPNLGINGGSSNLNISNAPTLVTSTVTVPAQPSVGGLVLTSSSSGVQFNAGDGVNTAFLSSNHAQNKSCDSSSFTHSMDALNNIGFFDNGAPAGLATGTVIS